MEGFIFISWTALSCEGKQSHTKNENNSRSGLYDQILEWGEASKTQAASHFSSCVSFSQYLLSLLDFCCQGGKFWKMATPTCGSVSWQHCCEMTAFSPQILKYSPLLALMAHSLSSGFLLILVSAFSSSSQPSILFGSSLGLILDSFSSLVRHSPSGISFIPTVLNTI